MKLHPHVIIAPTHGYKRKIDEVNDDIKNQEDAVNLEEKIPSRQPEAGKVAPSNTQTKRYHDMRPIHDANEKIDSKVRKRFENYERTKNKNGVFFPQIAEKNNKHIKGISDEEV